MLAARSRSDVDWLRAFGIFLVVWGHSLGIPDSVHQAIFSFHMPLFFFLSGLLLLKRLEFSFPPYVKQCARSLLRPYFFFAIIGYLYWFFIARRFGSIDTFPPAHPLLA